MSEIYELATHRKRNPNGQNREKEKHKSTDTRKHDSTPQQDVLEPISLAKRKRLMVPSLGEDSVSKNCHTWFWKCKPGTSRQHLGVSVCPERPPNPCLHLHRCRGLGWIPGSGTFPGEGNGNPLVLLPRRYHGLRGAPKASDHWTGDERRGGRGGHRASESVGSNPSP